jgi:hypothetical protein
MHMEKVKKSQCVSSDETNRLGNYRTEYLCALRSSIVVIDVAELEPLPTLSYMYNSVKCEISATTLQKTLKGETHILKCLKF